MGQIRHSIRTRYVIMDSFDDAMLSLALEDAYPGVVFEDSGYPYDEPRLRSRASIVECGGVAQVHFAERDWRPAFRPDEEYSDWYLLTNAPRYGLTYYRSNWIWRLFSEPKAGIGYSLPSLEHGRLSISFRRDVREERSFVRALFKLTEKLMTNRLKNATERDKIVSVNERREYFWAGHHMLEWCRRGKRRVLDHSMLPCDDWQPPDTPWHRDLRARVVARHGRNFASPPPAARWRNGWPPIGQWPWTYTKLDATAEIRKAFGDGAIATKEIQP